MTVVNDSNSAAKAVPSESHAEPQPLRQTRRWVEQVVVGLDLCPFARPVLSDVRYALSEATSDDEVLRAFLVELDRLQKKSAGELPTTLLVFSKVLDDFGHFLDALETMQALLEEAGLHGEIQLASFHPRYLFADSDEDDAANYSNRAPYPTVHLLRESMIAEAVASHPHPERIPEENQARLRDLGLAALRELLSKVQLNKV